MASMLNFGFHQNEGVRSTTTPHIFLFQISSLTKPAAVAREIGKQDHRVVFNNIS